MNRELIEAKILELRKRWLAEPENRKKLEAMARPWQSAKIMADLKNEKEN